MNEFDTLTLEKNRLQAFCDEKQTKIDQYKKESQGLQEQIDYMRKDVSTLWRMTDINNTGEEFNDREWNNSPIAP